MAESQHERDQVDALKTWWNENGRSILAGIAIGLIALFGWRAWEGYRERQAMQASDQYIGLRAMVYGGQADPAKELAETIRADHARTPYAGLAALEIARLAAETDDRQTAESELRWAVENARQDVVRQLARLRLARVLIADGRAQEALDVLAEKLPPSFDALVEEVRGDVHVALGQYDKAREAYDRALAAELTPAEFLAMKRADLGMPANAP